MGAAPLRPLSREDNGELRGRGAGEMGEVEGKGWSAGDTVMAAGETLGREGEDVAREGVAEARLDADVESGRAAASAAARGAGDKVEGVSLTFAALEAAAPLPPPTPRALARVPPALLPTRCTGSL